MMLTFFYIGLSTITAYFVCRGIHVSRLKQQLETPIDMEQGSDGVYRYVKSYHDTHSKAEYMRNLPFEAAGVGVVTAIDAIQALSMLDPQVMKAVDFAYSDGIRGLLHSLHGGSAHYDGVINRLLGYAGEQEAAAQLAAAGHVVDFPNAANNPGWDLLVDGHPFQVKTTLDPSLIHNHLQAHPDIGVITNSEIATHFHDSNVTALNDFSHHQTLQEVHNTVDGLHDLTSFNLHIPWITLGISTFRETTLLLKGWTDVETAVTHVLYDTAGAGIGGVLGAKAGAAIGLALGPIGAAAGAVIGGVTGAIFGKKGASILKQKALREAQEHMTHCFGDVASTYVSAICDRSNRLMERARSIRDLTPRTLRSYLWPRLSDVASSIVANRVETEAASISAWAEPIKTQLLAGNNTEAGQLAIQSQMSGKTAYSQQFVGAVNRLIEAYNQVKLELRKLGVNTV